MKKFYTLAAFVLAACLFINSAFAQTYSGGTYTAVRSGNWHTPSGINIWDVNGEPPATSTNVHIIISTGVIVTLNASVYLTGNTFLELQDNSEIIIPNSNSTSPTTSNNILFDATSTASGHLASGASVNATGNNSEYDGFFAVNLTPDPTMNHEQKFVGGAPSYFEQWVPRFFITSNAVLSGPISINSQGTLPITLVNFNAALSNNDIDVTWTTEQENNSDHFALQRSENGINWQTIATVPAKGFSSIAVNYSYTDVSPVAGIAYYRLQSFDLGGKYTYSGIKVLRSSLISGIKIFPNPARNYVNVTLGNNITSNQILRLTDIYGKVLQEKQITNAAGTTVSLPVNNYAQGIYLLQVKSADGTQQTYKVLVGQN
jgi:hypothetical protein